MTNPHLHVYHHIYQPFTDAELINVGARLDNGGETSRVEANRLLATVRDLQHTLRMIDIANMME